MRNCSHWRTQTWKEFVLHHPARFLPTPYNPRALAELFISKVIVTSLEKLFIGLKELIVRKSSHVYELDALLNFFSCNFSPRGYFFSLFLLSNSKACIGMELAGGVYEKYSRFCKERIPCLVFREARNAADMREKGNKHTASVMCLQDLCQLQDTVLPVLFKGFDGRKLAKQKGKERFGGMRPI